MKKILHIIATPRGEASRTLRVSQAVLKRFAERHPGVEFDTLNLFAEALPPMTVAVTQGKYTLMSGASLTGTLEDAWRPIETQIERFKAADAYVVSTPMWNFSCPYVLKHYIDVIVQPGYLFRYTPTGVEGLLKGKRMVVVTSRGGDYGPTSPARAMDHLEPYLRAVFGFCGVGPIDFINAQPTDAAGPQVRDQKLTEAIGRARGLIL